MNVTMKWRGLEDLTKASIMLEDKLLQGAQQGVDNAAEWLANDIKSSWSPVAPSNPGASPAVVTGELDASVKAESPGRDVSGRFTAGSSAIRLVKISAPHAPLLEGGTYKMAARPFMLPAVKRARHTFPLMLKKEIKL